MTTRITGRICECNVCGWIGSYGEVGSMDIYEFCPTCSTGYIGFMPEYKPKTVVYAEPVSENESIEE